MTLQRRDILWYEGKQYALNQDILKEYFELHPERKPPKIGFDTSLYRGYLSEFEIIDNQLCVRDISIIADIDPDTGEEIRKSVIASALPDHKVCKWFSGILILFSFSRRKKSKNVYLKMNISEGLLASTKTLSEQEYKDLGNAAYDYF